MTPSNHRDIGDRFLTHAEVEYKRGNRLQAGEKAWGAVAHHLRAIALERDWSCGEHDRFRDISVYLAKEYDDPGLVFAVGVAEYQWHIDFYECAGDVKLLDILSAAQRAVRSLREMRRAPQPFTIDDENERDVVENLTGWRFAIRDRWTFVNLPAPPVRSPKATLRLAQLSTHSKEAPYMADAADRILGNLSDAIDSLNMVRYVCGAYVGADHVTGGCELSDEETGETIFSARFMREADDRVRATITFDCMRISIAEASTLADAVWKGAASKGWPLLGWDHGDVIEGVRR